MIEKFDRLLIINHLNYRWLTLSFSIFIFVSSRWKSKRVISELVYPQIDNLSNLELVKIVGLERGGVLGCC